MRAAAALTVALLVVAGMLVYQRRGIPLVDVRSRWSIAVFLVDSPLSVGPGAIPRPAITAADVTDVSAEFVADPFLISDGSTWHLFFEVFNLATDQADIGLATSADGVHWQYRQIVLDEPFHLSYPHVFQWQGEFYMVPESCQDNCIRLYRAEEFPTRWVREATLLEGRHCDATVFHYDEGWWMFTENSPGRNDTLRLFLADELTGPWTEHPQSPLIAGDANIARPGGRVVEQEGKLFRLAQDDDPAYGNALRAFEIEELTPTTYRERQVAGFQLQGTGSGWNADGMHHCDVQPFAAGQWIAAVDGHRDELVFGQD